MWPHSARYTPPATRVGLVVTRRALGRDGPGRSFGSPPPSRSVQTPAPPTLPRVPRAERALKPSPRRVRRVRVTSRAQASPRGRREPPPVGSKVADACRRSGRLEEEREDTTARVSRARYSIFYTRVDGLLCPSESVVETKEAGRFVFFCFSFFFRFFFFRFFRNRRV